MHEDGSQVVYSLKMLLVHDCCMSRQGISDRENTAVHQQQAVRHDA